MDDRVYASGTEYRVVDKHDWETSPFANVHKYSHDISPAKAALGSGGCTDCHSPGADFFYASVLTHLFDESGQLVVMAGVIGTVLHRVARQFLGREAPRDA